MRLKTITCCFALVVVLPVMAGAEIFTIQLDNGTSFDTRYQPRIVPGIEDKVMFLSDTGNWISLPADRVTGVQTATGLRGFGRVINTTTISLGFAPNEADPAEGAGGQASDSASALLNYLQDKDSSQQDYSVQQFVDTESAGAGGFSSGAFNPGSVNGSFNGGLQPQQYAIPGSATAGGGFAVGGGDSGAVSNDVQ